MQTSQIFEKIDLNNVGNIKVYRSNLEKEQPLKQPVEGEEVEIPTKSSEPIVIYEIASFWFIPPS